MSNKHIKLCHWDCVVSIYMEETWKPSPNQTNTFKQERNKRHDRFTIAGMGTIAPSIVGHIQHELSRFI